MGKSSEVVLFKDIPAIVAPLLVMDILVVIVAPLLVMDLLVVLKKIPVFAIFALFSAFSVNRLPAAW